MSKNNEIFSHVRPGDVNNEAITHKVSSPFSSMQRKIKVLMGTIRETMRCSKAQEKSPS